MTFIPRAPVAPNRDRPRPALGRLRKLLLGISPEEASFARRGFAPGEPAAERRLESIGRTFVLGYLAALEDDRPRTLGLELDRVEPELRGFAFEGAAMGLALLDRLTPWRRDRIGEYLAGPGAPHVYMVHVGVGWALARLRARIRGPRCLPRLDPLLRWLTMDGYGFHEGYFHWRRYVRERRPPERLSGYARRMFDQGLGRSLWFVEGADIGRIARTIDAFPPPRRPDLWSGVGLASAYAGGTDRAGLEAVRESCGAFRPQVAQGVAFAAKARLTARNPAPHTELACTVICGVPAEAAARITDEALEGLSPGGMEGGDGARQVRGPEPADPPEPARGPEASDQAEPAYEVWRRRIQARFA